MRAPVLVVGQSAGRADVPVLSQHLAAIARAAPAGVVICDVRTITSPDAGTIDVLARLQVAARRLGCGIRLYGAHPRLRELLLLTGLSEVLPLLADPGSVEAVEVVREAEEREDPVYVQEGVDPGDLVS
ncbi:STAS domain-containing protein [Phytohabitans kaempferiae]|uniref:STAS domain-containing protein n=1 Tax=Phytohabitans kaempferiae TaxID=1620943 RepID=A0ABV6MDK0_9ACTN